MKPMKPDKAAPGPIKRWLTFMRSLLAGAAATIADLSMLWVLVGVAGLSPRLANVPALLVGATIQFFGNRHFAFDAARGSIKRQALWFTLTEVVALALNGVAFDTVARHVTLDGLGAVAARALISFVVFVGWSYPVWKRVFHKPAAAGQLS